MRFVKVATMTSLSWGITPLMFTAFIGVNACGDTQAGGPSFGGEVEAVSSEFVLTVVNETSTNQFVTVFQDHFGTNARDVTTLAWKTVEIAPDAQAMLEWTENYSFNWSSAPLTIDGTYTVAESLPAGTVSDNEVTLSDASGETAFTNLTEGPMSNELTIHIDSAEASFVGIGLANVPIFAAKAVPNETQIFDALAPDYTIFAGAHYGVGQPVDATAIETFESFSSADGTQLVATVTESAGELTWTVERN
jgi:hypothetical protein